jgi:flagellar biosynthesis chaperone FliJ
MEDFLGGSKPILKSSPDYSTRRKRRKAIDGVVQQLVQIKAFEERYRDNIPENLQNSSVYESAEEYIACLDEAIEQLIPF